MFAHFTAPENLPFAVALGLFFLIGILQTVSLLTGISLFGWLDNLLPDFEADLPGDLGLDGVEGGLDGALEADLDTGADADVADSPGDGSWIADAFAWMNFGKVPFIISFLLFLFLFSCIGYNAQLLLTEAGIGPWPSLLMAPLALVVAVFPLKWGNALMGRVLPRDETNAVSKNSYIGRVATITIGEATHERTAEAKLRGPLGRTHYVMVRADREGARFGQGEHVLLVAEEEGHFTCIAVNNPNLDDD
ncbi:DUF1449 family protein [Ruficoccus amylovorans]|uniref:DUF1449 family protein n=1 Tax=Ruficoccus amylovorans TaxID=1804625 RepID=A0A842HGG2_9BACT|nr:OB-fold-containig protein [Ruficoccus amylovorans]MBC2595270.1 DUF1449 family protein [Ruficoccus amylovorans]